VKRKPDQVPAKKSAGAPDAAKAALELSREVAAKAFERIKAARARAAKLTD